MRWIFISMILISCSSYKQGLIRKQKAKEYCKNIISSNKYKCEVSAEARLILREEE